MKGEEERLEILEKKIIKVQENRSSMKENLRYLEKAMAKLATSQTRMEQWMSRKWGDYPNYRLRGEEHQRVVNDEVLEHKSQVEGCDSYEELKVVVDDEMRKTSGKALGGFAGFKQQIEEENSSKDEKRTPRSADLPELDLDVIKSIQREFTAELIPCFSARNVPNTGNFEKEPTRNDFRLLKKKPQDTATHPWECYDASMQRQSTVDLGIARAERWTVREWTLADYTGYNINKPKDGVESWKISEGPIVSNYFIEGWREGAHGLIIPLRAQSISANNSYYFERQLTDRKLQPVEEEWSEQQHKVAREEYPRIGIKRDCYFSILGLLTYHKEEQPYLPKITKAV
ncbi:uncharacterized protein [Henckelia pumila]|uniref:uncharacterized protein n=1 Tax=Henckelia pumila TaxID=405737 RepID=UPI003C6E1CF3